jgi:hypothetical protein
VFTHLLFFSNVSAVWESPIVSVKP